LLRHVQEGDTHSDAQGCGKSLLAEGLSISPIRENDPVAKILHTVVVAADADIVESDATAFCGLFVLVREKVVCG